MKNSTIFFLVIGFFLQSNVVLGMLRRSTQSLKSTIMPTLTKAITPTAIKQQGYFSMPWNSWQSKKLEEEAKQSLEKQSETIKSSSVIAPIAFGKTKFYTAPETKVLAPKSFESSSKRQGKKFWSRKVIPLLGIAGFYKFGDIMISKHQDQKALEEAKQLIFDNSDDLAVVDPEMYEVCLQIMKDYGIRENINFRVKHSNLNENFEYDDSVENRFKELANPANNVCRIDTIIFSPFYKAYSNPHLIKVIAHELEHTRQFHKYPGSYHGNFRNINDIRKLEQAADAAAVDYQYCPKCLLSHTLPNGSILGSKPYEPEETEHGYFTSKRGYFATPDYELYADRGDDYGNEDPRCFAHKYFKDAHTKRNIPLKWFLPNIKPSLPPAKFHKTEK